MLEQVALSIISYLVKESNLTSVQLGTVKNWCQKGIIPADIQSTLAQDPDTLYDNCKQFLVQESIPHWAYDTLSPYAETFIAQTDAYYDKLAADWAAEQAWKQETAYGPCYDEAWQQGYQV